MKKKVKRFCKVFACALSIMVVMVFGFAVSADETITDLTGTEWNWNFDDVPDFSGASISGILKNISFTSNDQSFTGMLFKVDSETGDVTLEYRPATTYDVWYYEVEVDLNDHLDQYQNFTITGGSDVQNAQLISWITSNATQVVPEPPVPPAPSVFGTISTFLSGCLSMLGSVVTYATENAVLTIFMFGIAVISFSIGVLRRILSTRG